MLALKSFARSTLGELKDALVDDEEEEEENDDDDDEGEEDKTMGKQAGGGGGRDASASAIALAAAPAAATSWVSSFSVAGSVATAASAASEPVSGPTPAQGPASALVTVQPAASLALQASTTPAASSLAAGPAMVAAPAATNGQLLPPVVRGVPSLPKKEHLAAVPLPPGRPPGPLAATGLPSDPETSLVPEAAQVVAPRAAVAAAPHAQDVREAPAPAAPRTEEEEDARRRFAALLCTPGLPELLGRQFAADGGGASAVGLDVVGIWTPKDADALSLPMMASACAEALRRLAPRLLAGETDGLADDKQRLLASFSERYDALFEEHGALLRRCRELTSRVEQDERLADEVQAWQSAYSASSARVEVLTLESGDLKERMRVLEAGGLDPEERSRWQVLVAQREAEVKAAGEALRQLQEVMEDGTGTESMRCGRLEDELKEARQQAARFAAERQADEGAFREARAAAAASAKQEEELLARCQRAEREAAESGAALEALLQEKSTHLDEREHSVDRRLVTSTLSSCLEHIASGRRGLAEQILGQTLQVLGGAPEEAVQLRQRLREAEARRREAPPPPAEPLGEAFLEFLTREASEGASDAASPPPDLTAGAGQARRPNGQAPPLPLVPVV